MTEPRLLVVCTANLLRSPIAEAAFVAWQQRLEVANLQIGSAGVSAVDGTASPVEVIQAASPFHLDLHAHRARRATRDDVRESTLVLGMTEGHRDALQALVPSATPRIFTLPEFARLLERTPTLTECDGDLSAFVSAAHRERPRRPRPRSLDDIEDAIGGSAGQLHSCIVEVVALVGRVTARLF